MDVVVQIDEFLRKQRIYLKPGEKAPEGVAVQRGKWGGMYYESHEQQMPKKVRPCTFVHSV